MKTVKFYDGETVKIISPGKVKFECGCVQTVHLSCTQHKELSELRSGLACLMDAHKDDCAVLKNIASQRAWEEHDRLNEDRESWE